MKYICSQCTGRSGEEHTFHLDETPRACPYCGTQEDYHLQTIEEYLREQLSDAEWDADHWEEKYDEMKVEKKELEVKVDELRAEIESLNNQSD